MMCTLNLVFHRIVDAPRDIQSAFDVERGFLATLLSETRSWLGTQDVIRRVRVYFDDNHKSTLSCGITAVASVAFKGVCAVPVESIGQPGRCSEDDLAVLASCGFAVVPHGFSHVGLAIYDDKGAPRPTPPGGVYQNRPPGRDSVLTAEEVLFQLRESRTALRGCGDSEFVLPYGLYNDSTIAINREHHVFDFLTTCDPLLDFGQPLRPRYLVRGGTDVQSTMDSIRRLSGSDRLRATLK